MAEVAPASSAKAATTAAATAANDLDEQAGAGSDAARMPSRSDGMQLPEAKPAPSIRGGSEGPQLEQGNGPGGKPTMLAAVAFDLEGKLSADEVRKTIDDSRDKFSPCLTSDSTVTVKAKVLPSGALSDVSVPSSVPNDAKLRDCVASVLKTLTFPKPKGFEPAGLRLDLALKKQLAY